MPSDQPRLGGLSESARKYAIVVHLLYLIGLFNGLTTVLGVIIAYVKRGDYTSAADRSHFDAAIVTFWVSLIGLLVGTVTTVILIGFVILFVLGVWYLYRSIVGLIRALDYKRA